MSRTIEIHIEELVLHGFSPHNRYSIGDAVQAALQNYFKESGLPSTLSNAGFIPYIDAGAFRMNSSQKPVAIGENIATSVYKSFSNES